LLPRSAVMTWITLEAPKSKWIGHNATRILTAYTLGTMAIVSIE